MLNFAEEERKNREAADARVTPEQAALGVGDFYAASYPQLGLTTYGRISKRYRGKMQHYRRVHAWPADEEGDIHVCEVIPISSETFERARALGWPENPTWMEYQ